MSICYGHAVEELTNLLYLTPYIDSSSEINIVLLR